MPISTNFLQSRVETALKGNIQTWHLQPRELRRDKIVHTHRRCRHGTGAEETAVTTQLGSFMKDVTVQMGWAGAHGGRSHDLVCQHRSSGIH